MELVIEIYLQNKAFEKDFRAQIARLLALVQPVEIKFTPPRLLKDENGKTVGQWSIL
jgi:hypothetical protein